MMDLSYLAAGVVALPLLLVKRWRTGKYRSGVAARLGYGREILPWGEDAAATGDRVKAPQGDRRILMLHCVSVGELNSVQTLIKRLLAADERLHITVTTTTDTGWERAQKLFAAPGGTQRERAAESRVCAVRFPFDFSWAMRRLIERVKPDVVALVELETWPNFLTIAQRRGIAVVIINGRLSEKSFPRYQWIRPVMGRMLRKVEWLGVQTEAIRGRFAALGADPAALEVIPTLKYDNAQTEDRVAGQEALAAAMGLMPEHRLIVGGSTGPGEEQTLLDMYQALRPLRPELRLAIVPRHPEVVAQVVRAIEARGLVAVRRTRRPDGQPGTTLGGDEVFVLDTMGELRKMYALSLGAFVGRSLLKRGGGGSDMIEVAALGKPCCFGPWTANFAEAVELLVDHATATLVRNAGELTGVVESWLSDPGAAEATGRRAQELIRRHQGSTDVYVARLLGLLRRRDTAALSGAKAVEPRG